MDYLLQFLTHTQSSFLFTSLDFWLFLSVALAGFSLCYKRPQTRNTFLLACSFFFYYKTGGYFIFILLLSIVLNYGIGLQIDAVRPRQKRHSQTPDPPPKPLLLPLSPEWFRLC